MKALRRMLQRFTPKPRVVFQRSYSGSGVGFDGAVHDRLTASWRSSTTSINSEIYNSLETLRARSRDLYNNNEYGRHFFNMLVNNVVGPDGVSYQSMARRNDGSLDTMDNDRLEARMAQWSMLGNCDTSRRLSRCMLERQWVLTLARDGEVLVRMLPGFDNEYGYALQLIDPDLLDLHHNQDRGRNQNRIVMGVEVDDYDAPIAYHLLKKHPSPFAQPAAIRSDDRTRIPAEQMLHTFIPLRAGQVRGVPWVHAGMRALRDLGGYREAAVVASRVGAAKMGFYRSEDGLSAPYDATSPEGGLRESAEAGTFGQLPQGVSLETWDPTYPHDQFDAFNRAMLRGLAGAFGVSYFNLNNDLESVNLSSARIGQQNERDVYKGVQNLLIEGLHQKFFPGWLSVQLMMIPELPMSRYDKFNAASWLPRTWPSPDPLKDAQTSTTLIDANLTSPQRVIRERGHDPDEVLREIEAWQTRLEEMGISNTPATGGQAGNDEPAQESEDGASQDNDDAPARSAHLH